VSNRIFESFDYSNDFTIRSTPAAHGLNWLMERSKKEPTRVHTAERGFQSMRFCVVSFQSDEGAAFNSCKEDLQRENKSFFIKVLIKPQLAPKSAKVHKCLARKKSKLCKQLRDWFPDLRRSCLSLSAVYRR
jgi:hypothetical protein